ncbi:ArsC family reductase [Marinomonas mediterranea]|jgi:transcriptional regulator, Spx/MgsR family|uniref:ArsC family protein n=1 Tax=Marinomonas mediterranea (strain ATCC 700492 / JCM 21426 / NBRC 103028 / MMB-1) TaxID=717774 RepID=F2JTZ3_MARM1|nr:ArsC family reductase [Marinomonas mediterranea]ADZ90414.1 ArsC family protein [Marinomonas mediterranea MMB-1]
MRTFFMPSIYKTEHPTMITIYGIKNCDTMKKAMRWLDNRGTEYTFHDYRKDGLDEALLTAWINTLGWESIVNKRGTTWRKLDDAIKEKMDNQLALTTLIEQPAMIKRPLLITGAGITLGFKEAEYEAIFE